MAFKLVRSEKETRSQLIADLRLKQDALDNLKNSSVPVPVSDLQQAAAELLVIVGEAEEFRDTVATRLRDEFEEKSEKWQESENGEAAAEFVDTWENMSFDDFEIDDDIANLDLDDFSDNLDNLPEE